MILFTKKYLWILIAIIGIQKNALANLEFQGQLQLQSVHFSDDKNSQSTDQQSTLYGRLNANYEKENYRINLSGFGRQDFNDKTRNMSAVDEAYLKLSADTVFFNIGWNVFNWSVLEFFHPVDTINSRNLDVNAERIERLGQPSVVLTKEFESSYLQLIVLTDLVDPLMPSPSNRNGAGIKLEKAQYLIGDNEWKNNPNHMQYGLHYQHTFDNFDMDLHWMHKMGNNHPIFAAPVQVIPPDIKDTKIYPFYFPVDQIGLAVQGVFSEWLFKIESVYYDFKNYDLNMLVPISVAPGVSTTPITQLDHTISAIGLEYTQHMDNGAQSTYFLEYQFILNTTMQEARGLNPFQRDLGFGVRYSFNDFNSNEIVAALIRDVDHYTETVFNFEYSFRFMQNYKFFTNLRVIDAPAMPDGLNALTEANGLKPLREADNLSFSVIKYF